VSRATAIAYANIALVKYWGKRDEALLLPEAGSLSVALDRLLTTTTVELGVPEESLRIDGRTASDAELRRAWLAKVQLGRDPELESSREAGGRC